MYGFLIRGRVRACSFCGSSSSSSDDDDDTRSMTSSSCGGGCSGCCGCGTRSSWDADGDLLLEFIFSRREKPTTTRERVSAPTRRMMCVCQTIDLRVVVGIILTQKGEQTQTNAPYLCSSCSDGGAKRCNQAESVRGRRRLADVWPNP